LLRRGSYHDDVKYPIEIKHCESGRLRRFARQPLPERLTEKTSIVLKRALKVELSRR
jgi:hypothetical protein